MRWLLVVCVLLSGCKKKDRTAEEREEEATALAPAAEALRAKMCACPDRACAEALIPEVARLRNQASRAVHGTGPSGRALERAIAVTLECQMRLVPPPEKPKAPAKATIADARAVVTALKDRMCKCTDRDCARLVAAELTRLRNRLETGEVTEDAPRDLHAAYIELVRCMTLAQDGGAAVLEAGSAAPVDAGTAPAKP